MSRRALTLRALRYRAVQSALLLVLAIAAVAACAVGPMYERAVEQAAFQSTLREAPPAAGNVQISAQSVPEALSYTPSGRAARLFDAPIATASFQLVFPAYHDDRSSGLIGTAVDRTDVCAHVRIVAGRCATGAADMVLSAHTMRAFALHVGQSIPLDVLGGHGRFDIGPLRIVGSYRVTDPAEPYWFGRAYETRRGFTLVPNGDKPGFLKADAAFISDGAAAAIGRAFATEVGGRAPFGGEVDLDIDPRRLDVDDVGALRAAVAGIALRVAQAHPVGDPARGHVTTGLPQLLDTADRGTSQTRVIIPTLIGQLAIVVVVLLGLVISVGVDQRRPELALARLRGRSRRDAARFVVREVAAVVVIAIIPGLLAAWLLCRALIAIAFPRLGVQPEWRWPVLLAGAAIAGVTLFIAASIARRAAGQPVQDLLRDVSRPAAGRGLLVVEAVVAVAAIGGVVVALTGGRTSTLALVTPGLLAILAGLVLSRAAGFVARVAGARAVWRGRITTATASLQVARSPNFRRVVILVCVAVALTVSAVDQWTVARAARAARADVEIGAPVVLTVDTLNANALVAATAKADPTGRYAMPALEHLSAPDATPVLAVTPSGLRNIARWGPARDVPSARTVARLEPSLPTPLAVRGQRVEARVDGVSVSAARGVEPRPEPISLRFYFRRPDGSFVDTAAALHTSPAPQTVSATLDGCAAVGCVLSRIEIVRALGDFSPAHIRIVLAGVQVGAVPVRLGAPADWQNVDAVAAAGGQAGSIAFSPAPGRGAGAGAMLLTSFDDGSVPVIIQHLDLPVTPPCLVAGVSGVDKVGRDGLAITGIDGNAMTCEDVGTLPFAPGVGANAVVVDIRYAIGASTVELNGTTAMIFLARDDPGRERALRAALGHAGLDVVDRQTAAARRTQYDQSPPAWAVQVALIVAFAALVLAGLMIVAVAFMSYRVRNRDLGALRLIGVPARTVRRAVIAEQVLAVVCGLVVGVVVGVVGAGLALPAVPLFVNAAAVPRPALTTAWTEVVLAGIVAALVLGAGAAGSSWVLARRLTSNPLGRMGEQ